MKKSLAGLGLLLMPLPIFAAISVDLAHQSPSFLKSRALIGSLKLEEINRSSDFNDTLHVRLQQTYAGHPVLGADAVMHISNAGQSKKPLTTLLSHSSFMNGIVYQDLDKDLVNTPSYVFDPVQMEKAIAHVISLYQSDKTKQLTIENKTARLVVYLDKKNKAHWAFVVNFFVPPHQNVSAEQPAYIIDAVSFDVYKH